VTTDNALPLELGGMPVHRRLTDALPALVTTVVERLMQEVPPYRTSPGEQLHGEVLDLVHQTIRTFVSVLRAGREPEADDLVALRRSATLRAEAGLPADAVTSVHHVGAQACLDFVARDADPSDLHDVFALYRIVLAYMRHTCAAVAAGYADAYRVLSAEEHDLRRSLLSALLDSTPVDPVVGRIGMRLPSHYQVVSLALGAHPDESDAGVDTDVAARRKLRRLRAVLDVCRQGPVLSMLTVDGGLVLIPRDGSGGSGAWLDALVDNWMRAAGADVVAATVLTEPDGVPAAVRLAHELRHVAVTAVRPPGVYRLDDLLLEYQFSRPTPAREQLAQLLAPVAERPDLLGTLRAYLDGGLNRRRTATAMGVHPNTVDYRLRRLAVLTGLDATRPEHLLIARAALTARDATTSCAPGRGDR